MNTVAETLYAWVRQTREVLLYYCSSLPPEAFTAEVEGFGWGSIRNLLVHTADCYFFWLGRFGLGEPLDALRPADHLDVTSVRRRFAEVDELVGRFFNRYRNAADATVTGRVRWQEEPLTVTALWLFSHTVTHEFHHKGQVVTLGRQLGFPAPDTDLVLPGPAGAR